MQDVNRLMGIGLALLLGLLLAVVPASAQPTAAVTGGATLTANTSHTINLCSVSSGDLIIVLWNIVGSTSTSITGFALQDSSSSLMTVYARVADGSEGATVAGTTGASVKTGHTTYCVTNWHGNLSEGFEVVMASPASGIDNPDPPSLNPAQWDVLPTLWIAAAGVEDSTHLSGTQTEPIGYGAARLDTSSSSSVDAGVVSATKTTTGAASEDPGTFTLTAAQGTVMPLTIAVRGVEAQVTCAGARRAFFGVGNCD